MSGLVGQWTSGWSPSPSSRELLLVLEDDTSVTPHYYRWLKRAIERYYLDATQWDARLFGISLQNQVRGNRNWKRVCTRYAPCCVPPCLNACSHVTCSLLVFSIRSSVRRVINVMVVSPSPPWLARRHCTDINSSAHGALSSSPNTGSPSNPGSYRIDSSHRQDSLQMAFNHVCRHSSPMRGGW